VRLTALAPSMSRLSRENVEASTSHSPMGLHDLLQGYLYLSYVFTSSDRWEAKTALSSLPTPTEVFLSKQGRMGRSRGIWNGGITVNESRHGCLWGNEGEDTCRKG
jgi:hypothetical protein